MDVLDVSRWQFGITTVYHFIFAPLTIGLAPLIAAMQTAWVVTGNTGWYRLTRFFGKLFLINFAMGVATGTVQEFQFGMNWSEYSRFVGDIFGAPLAFEGLIAFFFESTFIGLWIFGWSRLPRLVHLACIWVVAIAAVVGLFFTGDTQGKLMFVQQSMKMASAESLCHTETDPDFSFLTVGTHNNCDSVTHVIEVPYVLPFLAEGKFSGVTLQG